MSSGCSELEVIGDNNIVSSQEKRDETSDTIISKGIFQFSKLGYFGVLFVNGCISVCHTIIILYYYCALGSQSPAKATSFGCECGVCSYNIHRSCLFFPSVPHCLGANLHDS